MGEIVGLSLGHIDADNSYDMLVKLALMMMMMVMMPRMMMVMVMMMVMMMVMLGKLLRRVGGWVTSHNRAASRVQDTLGGEIPNTLLYYLCCTSNGKS